MSHPHQSSVRLFHGTTTDAASIIISEGFRDKTGNYMGLEATGVWVSNWHG